MFLTEKTDVRRTNEYFDHRVAALILNNALSTDVVQHLFYLLHLQAVLRSSTLVCHVFPWAFLTSEALLIRPVTLN